MPWRSCCSLGKLCPMFAILFIFWASCQSSSWLWLSLSLSMFSDRGITSMRKSKMSTSPITYWMSALWRVFLLAVFAWKAALWVSSVMNIWQASAKRMGASLEIMRTSSSDFIIFLMRARGSYCYLNELRSLGCFSISSRIFWNFKCNSSMCFCFCISMSWFCR